MADGVCVQIDDDPEELISAIVRTLEEVQSPVPWDQRIVLGCWNVSLVLGTFT